MGKGRPPAEIKSPHVGNHCGYYLINFLPISSKPGCSPAPYVKTRIFMSNQITEMPTAVMTPPQAARYIGLSVATLAKARCWGGGPVYLRLGRKIAYARADLDAWLAARRAKNTSD